MSNTDYISEIVVPLLDLESSRLLKDEYGISTVTFFKGNPEVATKIIRRRLMDVVNANPWLVGRIMKNKKCKNLQLVHSPAPVNEEQFERLFNTDALEISSEMEYQELCNALKGAIVKKGFDTINSSEPVCRITFAVDRDNPQNGFAFIFSLSHIVADGFTYYQIFNSIFSSGPVISMRTTRNQDASNKGFDAAGKKENDFFHSIPFILNIIKGMLFGKKARCYAFYIDPEKIKNAKNKIIDKNITGIQYLSTNDIISSSFAKVVGARFCIMLINFRNRIDGISDIDAGNYEGGLLFDDEVIMNPEMIRKTFKNGAPFQTTIKPLPGFWKGSSCRFCLTTNWATFAGSFELKDCEQSVHLPLYDPATFPADVAIIFKPKPDKLAVMYLAKTVSRAKLISMCEVGATVSDKMFE